MKIGIYKSLDPMEGDRGLEVLFFKDKGEKDFDLKVWRLQRKEELKFIAQILVAIAKGHSALKSDTIKNVCNDFNKNIMEE